MLHQCPVGFLVALRLVVASKRAHLVELGLEQLNKQAVGDEASDSEELDGLYVAGVVTKVHGEEEEDGHPTCDLDGATVDVVPTPTCGGLVEGGNAVVNLGCVRHGLLLDVVRLYRRLFWHIYSGSATKRGQPHQPYGMCEHCCA